MNTWQIEWALRCIKQNMWIKYIDGHFVFYRIWNILIPCIDNHNTGLMAFNTAHNSGFLSSYTRRVLSRIRLVVTLCQNYNHIVCILDGQYLFEIDATIRISCSRLYVMKYSFVLADFYGYLLWCVMHRQLKFFATFPDRYIELSHLLAP